MMNRREFMQKSALLPLCAMAGATRFGEVASALGQEIPVDRFHAPSRMKVGLNAYSFAKQLNNVAKGRGPGMSLPQLLEYCADPAHRFDAVDLTAYYFPNYSAEEATVPPDSFVDDLKRRAADLGLAISGTGVGNSFTGVPFDREGKNGLPFSTDEGGDSAKIAKDVERIKAWVEVAARLGAPVIRVFAGLEPSYLMKQNISPDDPAKEEKARKLDAWRAEMFPRMVEDLRTVVEHGRRFGVLIGIQNHGDFLKTSGETLELIEAVDSPWCGVIVDTGYFLTPDPYADVEKVLPYGVNFQIKEFIRFSPAEYSKPEFRAIELSRLMNIICRSQYSGYLPIETLSAGKTEPYDPMKDVPAFLERVRTSIQETCGGEMDS